ncbi:hypothetical protein [Sphingomonas longa]|nr:MULTISPECIES: hypothetical protein [Alphaproteobacteria]
MLIHAAMPPRTSPDRYSASELEALFQRLHFLHFGAAAVRR